MNNQEIEGKLSNIPKLQRELTSRTFLARVPMRKAFQFYRPFMDDVVLYTSVRNTTEQQAIALASTVLDFAAARFPEFRDRDVAKLQPFSSSLPWADSLVCFSPAVAQTFVGPGSEFLKAITYDAYPINHIEFAGDETEAEASVRKRHMGINDVTRKIIPIVFARYQFADGAHSARHFAVGSFDEVVDLIRNLVRVGGSLEIENFERARCRFAADPTSGDTVTASLTANTKHLRPDEAIAMFEQFTTKGAASANQPRS